jgi:hypothetical protein
MCTVTFIPRPEGRFLLTSSRDVSYARPVADPPQKIMEKDVPLYYPKDGKAGGTWIGSSRDERLICLLNGGFENHVRQAEYRRSRGLVVKDLLIAEGFVPAAHRIDLDDIEPFTLVVVDWKEESRLIEFVWDGTEKHFRDLEWGPRIWSSSTLYDPEMVRLREKWFARWKREEESSQESILQFHRFAGEGLDEVDVFMRRPVVGTVSITQVSLMGSEVSMQYWPYLRSERPGRTR